MLVLTRRPGEALLIGQDIRLVVLGVEGERVKLGIEAPREVTVVRSELLEAVREANLQAARAPARVLERLQRALAGSPTERP
ncbi:carbon storage regulator CsrA [Thermomicrobium sp. 4228-Ro]|uniref:carbon storage regulator CsrA n=1 Tax=Thermomicrobium sp. 4228-Ro TaxID=2993937 RepID=UPI0022499EED|nr:carbon storage regulator CsrA [Thermomicrobium sp. 4228-Ro]MCX2727965.1 carbon storage regulator CsrA [Thermomicrobium sp. 4228-Ro]